MRFVKPLLHLRACQNRVNAPCQTQLLPFGVARTACAVRGLKYGVIMVRVFSALLLWGVSWAGAMAESAAPLPSKGHAKPLTGWVAFCDNYPQECAIDLREPEVVRMTPQLWQHLLTANVLVNTFISPMTDDEQWGVPELWTLGETGKGDCEDYALRKRQMLAELGVPRRAMRVVMVVDEREGGHAVLAIRTTQGELILDNLRDAILPWQLTGYRYVKRENGQDVGWVKLGSVQAHPPTHGLRGTLR